MNNLTPRPFPAAIVCLFTTLFAIPGRSTAASLRQTVLTG